MPGFHDHLRRLEAKAVPVAGVGYSGFGPAAWGTWPNAARVDLWREHGRLDNNAIVARAVTWIRRHVGLGRLVCGNAQPDGTYKEIAGHPMIASLTRPGGFESWEETLGATVTDLCFGNAYWLIQDPKGPNDPEVAWLPAALVWAEPETDGEVMRRQGPVRRYWYTPPLGGKAIAYPPERIVHFRDGLTPDRINGRNDVAAQIGSAAAIDLLIRFTVATLRNGHAGKVLAPKSGGLVDIAAGSMEEAEMKAVARGIEAGTSGENAGRITKSSMPLDVLDVGLGPEQMALDRIGDLPIALALGAMGLNMLALDLPGSHAVSTFANRAEGQRAAIQEAVIPREDIIAGKLATAYLVHFPRPAARDVWWDRRNVEVLKEASESRANRAVALRSGEIATLNEARDLVDLPPVPEGDLTPGEEAEARREQALEIAGAQGEEPDRDDVRRNGKEGTAVKALPFARWVTVAGPAGDRHALQIGGGVAMEIYYQDDDGQPVPRDRATRCEIVELDAAGDHIARTHGSLTPAGNRKSEDIAAIKAARRKTKAKPKGSGGGTRRAGVTCSPTGSGRGNPCHAEGTGHFAREGGSATVKDLPSPTVRTPSRGNTVGEPEHLHAVDRERQIAQALGGRPVGRRSGKDQPMDVLIRAGGQRHGIEVKTLSKGSKQEVTMHADAQLRKAEYAGRREGRAVHLVAIDDRAGYGGGAFAASSSGHQLYYKRGAGRYTLRNMHPVKDLDELRRLVRAKDADLPEAARAPAGWPPRGAELDRLKDQAGREHAGRLERQRRARAEGRGWRPKPKDEAA